MNAVRGIASVIAETPTVKDAFMKPKNRHIRVGRMGMFCVAMAICCVALAEARAAEPGDLFEWSPANIQPAQTIRFRYCPAGTIRAGRPAPAREGGRSTSAIPPTSLRAFYLGETEVTLAQFRAVLGESGMAALKQEAAKFQAMNPQLFTLVQQGEQEPALFVRLDGAVQFCLRLQSAEDESRSNQTAPSIETRRIRLPSHIEWQYGARAIADAGQQSRLPHFNREFKFAELSAGTQEKCREVWSKLGRTDPFVGSQAQLLDLTAAVGAEEQAKVKEVLSEWFTKLLDVPPRKGNGFADVRRVGQAPANAWGIRDCHDNLTEWVIWAASSERRDDLWQSLSTKVASGASLNGQSNLFLAGGFFSEPYHGEKMLAHFALWGGPKLTDGIPQPFDYDPSLVGEFSPGFRVVLERTIATDWLFVLRRGLYSEGRWQPSAKARLDESQRLLNELADANHPGKIAVELYRTLHGLDSRNTATAAQMFDRLALAKTDVPVRAKPNLAALLDDTPKPAVIAETAPVNDDGLFWRALSVVQSSTR